MRTVPRTPSCNRSRRHGDCHFAGAGQRCGCRESAILANYAAALVVQEVGAATVSLKDIELALADFEQRV